MLLKNAHKLEIVRLFFAREEILFGYNNLIVDMINFQIMKELDVPVIFDATHSLQLPEALDTLRMVEENICCH